MTYDRTAPPALFDGTGAFYRRMIAIAADGRVEAGLEDDFHRVELMLEHDGKVVTAIEGRFPRPPFDACPLAASRLLELAGRAIGSSAWHVPQHILAKLHCTHMLDLALFAMAQAGRGGQRQYDFRVQDGKGPVEARAMRDGHAVLEWVVQDKQILEPALFAGQSLVGIGKWALALEDAGLAEAAILLRRACRVSGGRSRQSYTRTAGALMERMSGACHTFQPGNEGAKRNLWSIKDFAGRPDDLLAGFPGRRA